VTTVINFEANFALRKTVRDFLSKKRFERDDFEWMEQKSTFESKFLLKGEPVILNEIIDLIEQWMKRNGVSVTRKEATI
jgi:hypothetical protein